MLKICVPGPHVEQICHGENIVLCYAQVPRLLVSRSHPHAFYAGVGGVNLLVGKLKRGFCLLGQESKSLGSPT